MARASRAAQATATSPAPAVEPWEALADALLQQEALVVRMGQGVPPRELAGVYIGDDEIDRIITELPGLDGPPDAAVGPIRDRLAPRIAQLRTALAESLTEPTTLFGVVVWNARLGLEDAEVLALLAAVELDPQRQRLVGYIQDNVTLPRLTLATLRRLFPPPHPGALSVAGDGRLRRAGLVEVQSDGPWAVRTVSLAPPVTWSLAGDTSLDPDLPPSARIVASTEPAAEGVAVLLVTGGDKTSRLQLAMTHSPAAAFLVAAMPARPEEWDALVREATLAGLSVFIELDGGDGLTMDARRRIERADHLAWVLSSKTEITVESLPERPWREVRAENEEAAEADWQAALGLPKDGGHRLDRDQLRLVALAYPGVGGNLSEAVRRLASGHLDSLARRVRPRRDWSDVVLPADQLAQLQEMTARYRHRDTVYEDWGFRAIPSAGLVALFAGPSGTGKTLTAEIIAGELGLDLYKVDLSSVVSKYIGETEKNLEKIFDAAAAGNLVLFFDEADSLFGKRSEVSDAHDRYANIEVSYLLQRLEAYDGLVVLATNFQKNIDQAFLRRIHVSVNFPMPEEDQRRAIWSLSFPPDAPAEGLDVDFLARQFKIAGGSIRNAALSAAFVAAEAGTPITMEAVMLSLKREFQKLGRLRTESEFDRYFDLVKGDADAASPR